MGSQPDMVDDCLTSAIDPSSLPRNLCVVALSKSILSAYTPQSKTGSSAKCNDDKSFALNSPPLTACMRDSQNYHWEKIPFMDEDLGSCPGSARVFS